MLLDQHGQVIASDFARLQAETEASEEAAKAEFDEFMEDSKAGNDCDDMTLVFDDFDENRILQLTFFLGWFMGLNLLEACFVLSSSGKMTLGGKSIMVTHGLPVTCEVDKATKSKTAEHKESKKQTKSQEQKLGLS